MAFRSATDARVGYGGVRAGPQRRLAILPASFPAKPGCDDAARMIPATTIDGDFYDFIELPDGRIGLVMADVSGNGYHAVQLLPRDRLLFTARMRDGFNPADEACGTEALIAKINANREDAASALVERICRSVATFAGAAPQSDDTTLTLLSWGAPH